MLTVLIPVYNTRPAPLLECFHSLIAAQKNRVFDINIIDDGSTHPETLEVLKMIVNHPYVRLLNKENGGTASALNLGHQYVKTEWVAIIGSDDICHPEKFDRQLAYIEKNPDIDVLGTNLFTFWDDDIFRKSIYTSQHYEIPAPRDSNPNWFVNHGTVIYKQASVEKVGFYNEKYGRGQDVELWSRMKAANMKFRNLTEVLYGYRRFR